jgi:hypothetical protein
LVDAQKLLKARNVLDRVKRIAQDRGYNKQAIKGANEPLTQAERTRLAVRT